MSGVTALASLGDGGAQTVYSFVGCDSCDSFGSCDSCNSCFWWLLHIHCPVHESTACVVCTSTKCTKCARAVGFFKCSWCEYSSTAGMSCVLANKRWHAIKSSSKKRVTTLPSFDLLGSSKSSQMNFRARLKPPWPKLSTSSASSSCTVTALSYSFQIRILSLLAGLVWQNRNFKTFRQIDWS